MHRTQSKTTPKKLDSTLDERKTTIRYGFFKTNRMLALVMSSIPKSAAWLAILAIGGFTLVTIGQEPAKKAPPRGRLPAYFKDLVSPDQREEIYAIQAKFNTKIDELEAEIEKLKKERDAQVERVLTPQQLARLKLLQDAKGKSDGQDADIQAPVAKGKADKSDKDVFPK